MTHNSVVLPPDSPADWVKSFENLLSQWRPITALAQVDPTPQWVREMASMRTRMMALKQAGHWSRGPHDLLSICGVGRRELSHSAALSWLCDPEAGHGLGPAFLERLLAAMGPAPDMTQRITVRTEVERARSRADVVVFAESWTLVVEVKVDAGEGELQCERLYRDWVDEGDVRFLLLSKSGLAPRSTMTEDAEAAWRTESWPGVRGHLRAVEARSPATARGNFAVQEYRRTLEHYYGRR